MVVIRDIASPGKPAFVAYFNKLKLHQGDQDNRAVPSVQIKLGLLVNGGTTVAPGTKPFE